MKSLCKSSYKEFWATIGYKDYFFSLLWNIYFECLDLLYTVSLLTYSVTSLVFFPISHYLFYKSLKKQKSKK